MIFICGVYLCFCFLDQKELKIINTSNLFKEQWKFFHSGKMKWIWRMKCSFSWCFDDCCQKENIIAIVFPLRNQSVQTGIVHCKYHFDEINWNEIWRINNIHDILLIWFNSNGDYIKFIHELYFFWDLLFVYISFYK